MDYVNLMANKAVFAWYRETFTYWVLGPVCMLDLGPELVHDHFEPSIIISVCVIISIRNPFLSISTI